MAKINTIRLTIFEKLANRRQELGLSISELESISGISRRTISRLERLDASCNITIESIERLAQSLELDPKDFFNRGSVPILEIKKMFLSLEKAVKNLS